MADETQTSDDRGQVDPGPDPSPVPEEASPTEEADARTTDGRDEPEAQGGEGDTEQDLDEGPPESSEWQRVLLSKVNEQVIGTLTLHYEARDVKVAVDGDAALRILKIAESRRRGGLCDVLSPTDSDAHRGWLVLRPEEPLALSWMPYVPNPAAKPVAIDPTVPG